MSTTTTTPSRALRLVTGAAVVATALTAGLMTGGCAMIDSEYGVSRNISLQGAHLDDLDNVVGLVASEGRLVIAHQGRSQGIAIVDTGTHLVTDFISLDFDRIELKPTQDGRILVTLFDDSEMMPSRAAWFNPLTFTFETIVVPTAFDKIEVVDSSLFYFHQMYSRITYNSAPANAAPVFRTASFEGQPQLIARTAGRYFLANLQIPSLFAMDSLSSLVRSDTIVLRPRETFNNLKVRALTTYQDKVFAILSRDDARDSSFVAVVDANTLSVIKIIPMNYAALSGGMVYDGLWYVYGGGETIGSWSGLSHSGGVETIDLANATPGGVVFSDSGFGVSLVEYRPVDHQHGYGLFTHPEYSSRLIVRKVTLSP